MAVKTNITINIVEPGSDVPVPDTGLFTHGIGGTEATAIGAVIALAIVTIVIAILYKKQKKQGKTTKLVHLVDSTKAVFTNKKRVTIGLTALALLASIGTLTALLSSTNKNNTNAIEGEEGLTINAESKELTIEVKDQPVFAVLPVQVTVEEATQAGYTLTAYTGSTDLVSTTNPNNKIPMVTVEGDELTTLQDNTWGLALDNEPTSKDNKVYKALSTDQDNPTILKTIDDYSETGANDTTTIYYGFYITPDVPKGIYESSDIHCEATTNEVATVVFNGNGLYFGNIEDQVENALRYIPGEKSAPRYSHTPNVNDEGIQTPGEMYPLDSNETFIYDFPGMSKVNIKIIESANDAGCNPDLNDYFSIWPGIHVDYTAKNNWESAVNLNGLVNWSWESSIGMNSSGGKTIFYYKYSGVDVDLDGSSVTIAYSTSDSRQGYCGNSGYGYYAEIIGYKNNKQVFGAYEIPGSTIPNNFLGWSEDPSATEPTYISHEDIEHALNLQSGETVTLYAIWQRATKIVYDGNGGIGSMEDQTITAGESDYLYENTFTREGYAFVDWNTSADGTGETYTDGAEYPALGGESREVILYAQWDKSCPADRICYRANGANASEDDPKMDNQNTSSNTDTTLWASNFRYDINNDGNNDYGFVGWSTIRNAADKLNGNGGDKPTIYGPNQTIATGDLSREGMRLYAVWIAPASSNSTLQNFICPSNIDMPVGNVTALKDTRDNQVYAIAKLADGNCWMIENLRLADTYKEGDQTISTVISSENTHNPNSGFTSIAASSSNWCTKVNYSCNVQKNLNTVNTASAVANMVDTNSSVYSYGNYYNWSSATAGQGSISSGEAVGDICPTGWQLPTGNNSNSSGSFYYLNQQMGGDKSTQGSNNWRSFPNNFIYAGDWYGASASGRGDNGGGHYWSSTAATGNYAYLLVLYAGDVYPGTVSYQKNIGNSVRCIAPAQ